MSSGVVELFERAFRRAHLGDGIWKSPDRDPDGSCKHCGTVMRGHFDGCPAAVRERKRVTKATPTHGKKGGRPPKKRETR